MRDIAFDGVVNFRDMGGYPTRFGRPVRWRRLYRAGEPVALTAGDIATLDGLGLRLVFDLRADGERNRRPCTPWDNAAVRRLHRDHGKSRADLPSILRDPSLDADRLRTLMIALYHTVATEQAESFRILFEEIAAGELPLMFHCAAGKDRTGVFAALLLDLLGVDRETIAADYLLTNRGLDVALARFARKIGRDDVPPTMWEPMVRVDRVYLDTMFAAVEAEHGTVEAYVAALGITEHAIASIRAHLLEPDAV